MYHTTSSNINSASRGLDLAAVHKQEKWHDHFHCNLELREGGTFLQQNLIWLSTDIWDDKVKDIIGTLVVWEVMWYSAVIKKKTRIVDVDLHRFITIDRVDDMEVYKTTSS